LVHNDYLVLPSYLFIISLTYSIGIIWFSERAKKAQMNFRFSLDLSLAFMLGGFIGARLFHVLYEQPRFYWEHPEAIFMFWLGGFVFFGGVLGALVATYLLIRRRGEKFLPWADLAAPVIAFGYAIGRIGCFLAGCCYGRECDLPWGVRFPPGVDAPSFVLRHPTQLYATFWELMVVAILLLSERRIKSESRAGRIFALWMFLHGIGRLIMEYFREDDRGPAILGLSVSTWFSIIFIGLGAFGVYNLAGKAANWSQKI
jgi:phosphatidylglycerol:prolipoprotein diacylglycerol transferase